MVIDCHTHVLDRGFWPDDWFDWVALEWASREAGREPVQIRGKIEDGLIDPQGDLIVEAMDAAAIDMAVILPLDWGPDYPDRVPIDAVNAHAAGVSARHPGRLIPFIGVDPRRPQAVDLVERSFRNGEARGLKLYPPTGFDPFDRRLFPIYELCVQYQRPVLFHTGETLPKMSLRHANPIFLQDVHATFPRLFTLIGHSGYKLWWREALSVAAHSINSFLELSCWIGQEKTTEDDQLAFIRQIAEARDRIGVERLLFGSDHVSGRRVRGKNYPTEVISWFRQMPNQAAKIGIRFTSREMDQLLGLNAARLLGL